MANPIRPQSAQLSDWIMEINQCNWELDALQGNIDLNEIYKKTNYVPPDSFTSAIEELGKILNSGKQYKARLISKIQQQLSEKPEEFALFEQQLNQLKRLLSG